MGPISDNGFAVVFDICTRAPETSASVQKISIFAFPLLVLS